MTWITWLIATVCSAAVGARIGRLTVRPPSLARTSVAIAAIAVAVAAAVRTPTVSIVLAAGGSTVPALVFVGCWVVTSTATALIAIAALSHRKRRALSVVAAALSALACAVIIAMALLDEIVIGSVFIAVTGIFAIGVGLRYASWNPLGRAIGLYLVGVTVLVVITTMTPNAVEPTSPWWAAAIVILSSACCSVMIEFWLAARLDLRRTRALHRMLIAAHPELADPDYRSATPVLQANDRVSEILDALYLHAGAGLVPAAGDEPVAAPRVRARDVAEWLHAEEFTVIDPDLLSTPVELSDRRWVRMIAREYDRLR